MIKERIACLIYCQVIQGKHTYQYLREEIRPFNGMEVICNAVFKITASWLCSRCICPFELKHKLLGQLTEILTTPTITFHANYLLGVENLVICNQSRRGTMELTKKCYFVRTWDTTRQRWYVACAHKCCIHSFLLSYLPLMQYTIIAFPLWDISAMLAKKENKPVCTINLDTTNIRYTRTVKYSRNGDVG